MYAHIYNLLCIRRELLAVEAILSKMTFGEDASVELQVVVEQMNQLHGLSHKIIKDFCDKLEKVDKLRYKVSKVKLLLASLSKKLNNIETNLTVLGNARANIEQGLEQLTAKRTQSSRKLLRCWCRRLRRSKSHRGV